MLDQHLKIIMLKNLGKLQENTDKQPNQLVKAIHRQKKKTLINKPKWDEN